MFRSHSLQARDAPYVSYVVTSRRPPPSQVPVEVSAAASPRASAGLQACHSRPAGIESTLCWWNTVFVDGGSSDGEVRRARYWLVCYWDRVHPIDSTVPVRCLPIIFPSNDNINQILIYRQRLLVKIKKQSSLT